MRIVTLALAVSVGLVAGLVFTGQLLPQSAQGQDGDSGNEGVVRAAQTTEIYKMSTKVNAKGVAKEAEKVMDDRTAFHVPEHFGQVFAVTGHGPDAVLWFKSGGVVRNAVVRRASERLLTVEQVSSEFKSLEIR